jgi:small nuclear ribonucleoprotein (snRNP)-like protein
MMQEEEKVVCRFADGSILKGYLQDFDPEMPQMTVRGETDGDDGQAVRVDDLKAVFFVRTFEGDIRYRETKTYGTTRVKGNRVFIKFKDGESLTGFLEGEFPWKRGFFLSRKEMTRQGFFLLPVDEGANNVKVFVVAAAVADVTVVP